jgi:hypothetical protein
MPSREIWPVSNADGRFKVMGDGVAVGFVADERGGPDGGAAPGVTSLGSPRSKTGLIEEAGVGGAAAGVNTGCAEVVSDVFRGRKFG